MRVANPIAKRGEDLAAAFLQKKGYKILDRNFRKGYGELDIITIHNNILVFVEVKTRTSSAYGSPLEAITPWKLHALKRTAEYYALTHKCQHMQMRMDAISVNMLSQYEEFEIEHIENISG